jgi:hypothetical protein
MKSFDDSNIQWRPFAGMGGFVVRIFDVDPATRTVDFAIKFDPNTQVIIHRHMALTHTFVIEGDHVIYEPDGTLRESRPVGRYTISQVTGDVHNEGGGPNGCTLMYSVRGETNDMFDVLDEQQNIVSKLGVAEFQALMDAQDKVAA